MSVAEEAVHEIEQLGYNVGKITINAADYGVPQLRKRVIIFAISKDFGGELNVTRLLTDVLAQVKLEQRKELGLPVDRYVNIEEAISDLAGTEMVDESYMQIFATCFCLSTYHESQLSGSRGSFKPSI